MLYWDSSALLASLIPEKRTVETHRFYETLGSEQGYTSIITPLEFESAIQRRLREKNLTPKEADYARLNSTQFRRSVHLIVVDHDVLDTALHLQKLYSLRPGDALQLACARMGTDNPSKVSFLCLDHQLNDAADREGFKVVF